MSDSKPDSAAKKRGQVIDLFLHIAEQLGCTSDEAIAGLADVSPENIRNWKAGKIETLKDGTLATIKERIAARMSWIRESTLQFDMPTRAHISQVEIEDGWGPADVQQRFRKRLETGNYTGHQFLYFDPEGALAWESHVAEDYDQSTWIECIKKCARTWIAPGKDARNSRAYIYDKLFRSRKRTGRKGSGIDVISLGPGDGAKEYEVLRELKSWQNEDEHLQLTYVPVDISIPLLLKAQRKALPLLAQATGERGARHHRLRAFCADFEDGDLRFLNRLPSAENKDVARLITMFGSFQNLFDEEAFVRDKLSTIARRGDLVWLEVTHRITPIEKDRYYALTKQERPQLDNTLRLLLEGPYGRLEAAKGRTANAVDIRVSLRDYFEDGPEHAQNRIPGSYNFFFDLVVNNGARSYTMVNIRRYELRSLQAWFGKMGYSTLDAITVPEDRGEDRRRNVHLLLEKQ